ncbi:MAG: nitroreductase family protein [Christensenella sp.]|uniref:nitroreductase family protein n=1 Tax=Christensenella sp. TaxID=1935934 RepID=UPI002B21EB7B|nr:nitroreductase family protein [Christensenella sp.]MEA5002520.1 nitroreductase family protein [Christensenella sp.]
MHTLECIHARRSIRQYTDRPISSPDLQAVLDAAAMAPSGDNLQPWYYLAVQSDAKRQRLLQLMAEVDSALSETLAARFQRHPEVLAETRQFIRTLGGAPVILLVFMQGGSTPCEKTALQGVAASIENALLAARSLGIGSCWLTAPGQTPYGAVLGEEFAPEMGELAAMVSLGYPKKWPAKPIPRRQNRFAII